jgi:retinol dehydrogenase-12
LIMETPQGMRGKVCLITGATSGIGLVAARELARQGAQVVLVGRNRAKTESVVAGIQSEIPNASAQYILADLSSQAQIHDLARQFHERHHRLDVLINNAGGIWMRRTLTVDGIEMTFAVNHLVYFLLTDLLLDTLKSAAHARIVNVASGAHRRAHLDFDNLQGERGYGGWQQYCRSKLMNLLFTYELARRLTGTGVTANALHPGFVATGFASNNGWKGWLMRMYARLAAISPEQGAHTIIYLASSPDVAGISGRYFVREREQTSSPESLDEAAAKKLWDISESQCKSRLPGVR